MLTLAQLQRIPFVRAGRALNTSLDYLFYDVGSLTLEEKARLSASNHPEGSILIVHPKAHSQEISNLTPLEFIFKQKQDGSSHVDAVVVPGVGSSALGTAALARNAADYLDRPVAGIVSGYGMADVITEALGGWFVLGFNNSIRDRFAKLFDALELKDHVWDDPSYRALVKDEEIADFDLERFVYASPDSAALLLTMYHLQDRIKLLIGHSKGNYIIENALEGLVSLNALEKYDIPEDLHVVTLGAVIRFPEEFSKVNQFIGDKDYFGMLNSRTKLDQYLVPGSWHSLNTRLPGHLAVEEALELAGVQ